jgi:serine/threonine protein kinase
MNIPGYSIEHEIGHGGMATVYLALQESLQRHVALKVLSPALAMDKNFSKRFLREGRLAARLADPRIVKVFDIGFHDHIPYISMEYLAGGTLKERIEKKLPLQETLDIIKTVAGALGYAHQRGIIHRDIKPQNILFTESGSPVLSDFGIAKALGSTTTIMTASGVSLGTPRYMSPEQIKGQQIDSRADLYSLGVLFYEMLTGELPYFAEDSFAMAFMHVAEPIPELPLNLAVFQPVLNKLLAKKAVDRFETAEQFIDAIKQIERTGSVGAISDETGFPKISKKTKPTSRRSTLWILATTVVSLLIAAALYLVMNPPSWFFGSEERITALNLPEKSDTEDIKPSTTLEESQPSLAEEKQQQARQFLVQAIQYQQKGLLEDSLQQIAQGLQIMPEHHRLLALQEEVKSQLRNSARRNRNRGGKRQNSG